MALNKKPVTGMKDILPEEMAIREYVQKVISETYAGFGFTRIETPCVETIENLTSKSGGDNEKLIFRILKRGEKLNLETAQTQDDLVDSGLRYDLTVPLVRYYSNNSSVLPAPFKALQMGNVWRADRPQRGRYRQFMQCDIDILGEADNLAEIELILATTTTLGKLDFKGFEIRINDRRLLKAMAAWAGFAESDYDSVFITIDKMDKIGIDGVRTELLENGYAADTVEKYVDLLNKAVNGEASLGSIMDTVGEELAKDPVTNLEEIITAVEASKQADFKMVFDPTLVRGMSYYTGTIFEIAIPEFGGSCGGGGRYDEMVGKFTGQSVPACGFSIGFERIVLLLTEKGFKVPGSGEGKAYLIEKGISGDRLSEILAKAADERKAGKKILTVRMNKNKKFQKEQLTKAGYTEFEDFYREALK
ncbi:MAG: histidine--tRNA ligase [Lachnospiraceae bacterium]|nr:histidine--tRNA ligase [Lachnospiraceae bacterium]